MNLKTAIMAIPCIACLLFCVSCSNDPPDPTLMEPLSDEEISSNLVTMRGVFSNGSIDPELLIGKWKLTKFAYTADGKKISNVVAISDLGLGTSFYIWIEDDSRWEKEEIIRAYGLPDLPSGLIILSHFRPMDFLHSISDNLINYHSDRQFLKVGVEYSDEGWKVYKALQNTFSFVIIDRELIIHFTGGENKNLIILKKR